MPLGFRKSFKLAPGVRMTLSKSGVSYSVGGRGMRMTTSRRGTYVSVGAGGIYYRQKIAGAYGQPANTGAARPTPAYPGPAPGGYIPTADVDQLIDASSIQTVQAINTCISGPTYAWIVLLFGFAFAFVLMKLSVWLFPVVGGAALTLAWFAHRTDVIRRTYPLAYQFDPAAEQRWRVLQQALTALAHSQRLWRVDSAHHTGDWKRNAGASRLIGRHRCGLTPRLPPGIVSNVTPFCLHLGFQELCFFPDRIYVRQGGRFGALDYQGLSVMQERCEMIEHAGAPPDAQVLEYRWQKVNRDGSPDRRFKYNSQLPICLYAYVELQSPTGLNIVLQASNVAAAEAATGGLQHFAAWKSAPAIPTSHAWDCQCGTRNATQFSSCRQCRAPRAVGRPVVAPISPSLVPGALDLTDRIQISPSPIWAAGVVVYTTTILFIALSVWASSHPPVPPTALQDGYDQALPITSRPTGARPTAVGSSSATAAWPVPDPSTPDVPNSRPVRQPEQWSPADRQGDLEPAPRSAETAPPANPTRRRPRRRDASPSVTIGSGGMQVEAPRTAAGIGEANPPISGLPAEVLPCGHQLISTTSQGLGGGEVAACIRGHTFRRTQSGWSRF